VLTLLKAFSSIYDRYFSISLAIRQCAGCTDVYNVFELIFLIGFIFACISRLLSRTLDKKHWAKIETWVGL
jgi:hypothetical protein